MPLARRLDMAWDTFDRWNRDHAQHGGEPGTLLPRGEALKARLRCHLKRRATVLLRQWLAERGLDRAEISAVDGEAAILIRLDAETVIRKLDRKE